MKGDFMVSVDIPIFQCSDGDIIACDIVDGDGILLAAKDTIINSYIKTKLIEKGIVIVRVSSSTTDNGYQKFKQEYKETVIRIKSILNNLSSGKNCELEEIMRASEIIYESINQSDYIVKCLSEIRESDEYTYKHCVNTAFLSMLIGKWMELPEVTIKNMILSGFLHDIGKVRVPNEVLNKRGSLTREEFNIIKKHTLWGYEILKDLKQIDIEVKKAALLHHERIDCSGYPFNAPPENVGLCAKVVAVADVYDAMTSNRVYKKGVTPFDAFKMFATSGLGSFDTAVMNTFIKHIAVYFMGTRVNLNNGKNAEVVYIPPHNPSSPIIRVGADYIDLTRETNLKIESIL